jgi:NADH-ubiquinone oxidoreductase chain 5
MAIAAPTPISALVHSSTLVTAGLYLMLRFRILFVSFPILSDVMVLVCIFTSLYAGLNSLFETDLKKLIALSTLSHLGFIGLSLFLGFIGLSLFHLLTHALFKRLLFIVIGDIMTNLNHSQDIRFLSSGIVYTPASSFIMSLSLLNLLGAPSLCGFFSKDLILESLHYSNARFFVVLVCYTNVIFTYFYTLQFFFFFFQSPKVVPLQLAHKPLLFHSNALFLFALFSLPFPFLFLSMIAPAVIFVSLPLAIKLAPLALSLVMLCSLFLFLTQPVYKSPFLYCFFGGMSGLTALFLPLRSSFYHSVAFKLVRSSESGVFNYFTNNLAFRIVLSVSF